MKNTSLAIPAFVALLTLTGCPGGGGGGDPETRCDFEPEYTAESTAYNSTTGSNSCGIVPLDYVPEGYFFALPPNLYDEGNGCGSCYEISGPAGTVVAVAADICYSCAPNQVDLSLPLALAVNGQDWGRINVQVRAVPCDAAPEMKVYFEGSNSWFLKIRVAGARTPVATVELLHASGDIELTRTEDGAFRTGGHGFEYGSGPFTFRVTDIFGEPTEITVPGIDNDAAHATGVQFPACEL